LSSVASRSPCGLLPRGGALLVRVFSVSLFIIIVRLARLLVVAIVHASTCRWNFILEKPPRPAAHGPCYPVLVSLRPIHQSSGVLDPFSAVSMLDLGSVDLGLLPG